jgi:hypothetical protein
LSKIDTIENWKIISKNSSNGGWKFFFKENVGNVSSVLNSSYCWLKHSYSPSLTLMSDFYIQKNFDLVCCILDEKLLWKVVILCLITKYGSKTCFVYHHSDYVCVSLWSNFPSNDWSDVFILSDWSRQSFLLCSLHWIHFKINVWGFILDLCFSDAP